MPFGGKTNFDLMDNIKSGIKAESHRAQTSQRGPSSTS